MHPATLSFVVLVLAATGCGNRQAIPPSKNEVNVQLATKWIELAKLRAAADEHLHSRYPDFDLSGVEVTANVYRNDTNSVMFQYFGGFGVPVYYVRFDSLGQITFSTNRIATEGPQ